VTNQVAVRDVPLTQLTVWHELGDDGRPACRHGTKPECSYRVVAPEALPAGVSKCAYCSGEHTARSGPRPGTLAHTLEQADPEEVFGR